jgi:transposase-like protein
VGLSGSLPISWDSPRSEGGSQRWLVPPKFRNEENLRIVLSVLRGEAGVAETARREKVSETSIAKWRDLFLEGGARALADGARRAPSRREVELERRLEQVTSALGRRTWSCGWCAAGAAGAPGRPRRARCQRTLRRAMPRG